MGGAAITRKAACALMKNDWAADKKFCVDTNSCSVTKEKKNEFCFDAFKRSSVIYVRDDTQRNVPNAKNVPHSIPKPVVISKPISNNKLAQLNALKNKVQSRK